MKKTQQVTLKSGLRLTVDLERAGTPEASLALYQNDREGNTLGMIHFLTLALGPQQRDAFIKSLQDENGNPGTWDDMAKQVRELFSLLGEDGKKS